MVISTQQSPTLRVVLNQGYKFISNVDFAIVTSGVRSVAKVQQLSLSSAVNWDTSCLLRAA